MNESFLQLSKEKQQRILNAGYKLFSQNPYKKAPAAEIAAEADISKALLFYYFHNKLEFYFYLWDKAIEATKQAVRIYKVTQTSDFFEMLTRSLFAKCALMRRYPFVNAFCLRAYFEQLPEIRQRIQPSFAQQDAQSRQVIFRTIDCTAFRDGIDLQMMYQEILWASDGYMHESYQSGEICADRIQQDFLRLIAHWKKIYLKEQPRFSHARSETAESSSA